MSASLGSPTQPVYNPGLLLTHDWRQIHTEHGLSDTKVEDSPSGYQTNTFPITSASQYYSFVNRLGRYDDDCSYFCPLQLIADDGLSCESSGNSRSQPISAVVKTLYQVTHNMFENGTLSEHVVEALQDINFHLVKQDPKDKIVSLLEKYGSHCVLGKQELGKCFSWMLLVEEECNLEILGEIASEIFSICEKDEAYVPASQDGSWYDPKGLINCASWIDEKNHIMEHAKLRVAQWGTEGTVCLSEWKRCTQVTNPVRISSITGNVTAIWEMILKDGMKFQSSKTLATAIKEQWKELVGRSQHVSQLIILATKWNTFAMSLGVTNYLPCKLSLQTACSLRTESSETADKGDVLWKVLCQIILMNSKCREQPINEYAKRVQPVKKPRVRNRSKKSEEKDVPAIPHPMDVLLLIFSCSNFHLRAVLAQKLFMCRLAIPFIIPTQEDTVEMLLWPLRSIIMEWRNSDQTAEEDAMVKCKLNMVAFMRLGQNKFSKSKLMNELLSSNGHSTFFHKGSPCGNLKRQISNGTVEISHFLTAGSQQDQFTKPALFFNLRGDACDYPVQFDVLLELATMVVLVVDVDELSKSSVQKTLKQTVRKRQHGVAVVLTNSNGKGESDIIDCEESFFDIVGKAVDENEVASTYEVEGHIKNESTITNEVKELISMHLKSNPSQSLEKFAASQTPDNCLLDEISYQQCSMGKKLAEDLLSELKKVDVEKRKTYLLPQQGNNLHRLAKLLRKLHKGTGSENSISDKEEIKKEMKDIRHREFKASKNNQFMTKVISLLNSQEETKEFAIRWVQMELDALSRTQLPQLQNEKNKIWCDLMEAHNEDNSQSVQTLQQKLKTVETNIADVALGWEHLMREVGQMYDVSLNLKHAMNENQFCSLPGVFSQQLLEGHPMELMDGDHGFIPIEWVKAVFDSLAQRVGQYKKIFVVSIMGIQSSGKSTLLNTMFGLQFAVSGGRCTRGIYAQLLPASERSDLPFDYMLVLDSEGLRAHELGDQNYEHDNELATLTIGLADLALINMKGEGVMEMTDVLQIVVFAFLRIKQADFPHKRQCMFIHQNVAAVNAQEKLTVDRQKLQEQLDNMAKQAAEAHGLPKAFTSFSRLISFNSQQDVVYFSDLWQGDPPMATINQGYSDRAAATRQKILEDICKNFSGSITVSDFSSRLEDMWNGVLAEDFVFSCRNSLAAKVFIQMEREFARLTLAIEQDLLQWSNTQCKIQINNCKTEDELHQRCLDLKQQWNTRIAEQLDQNLDSLSDFFENHSSKEIIIQWKSEKRKSFELFRIALKQQTESDLESMKLRKLFDLQQRNTLKAHEQEIVRRAVDLAEQMRGKCPDDEELTRQFDELWDSCAADLVIKSSDHPKSVLSVFDDILYEQMSQEGNAKYLSDQMKLTPLKEGVYSTLVMLHKEGEYSTPIKLQDILTDHVVLKDKRNSMEKYWSLQHETDYCDAVVKQANVMMDTILGKVDAMCKEDIMFYPLHARWVINRTLELIQKHNDLDQSEFAFSPQFKAMMAIRVACRAAQKFEQMNQRFEKKYGIQTQMQANRRRVLLLFKNTVKQTSAEVTASEDFCAAMRSTISDHVNLTQELWVRQEMHEAVGKVKYDLITKMLHEICQEEKFEQFHAYVTKPQQYATEWIQSFGNKLIFTPADGKTKYSEFADHIIAQLMAKIASSVSVAMQSVATVCESEQYSTWVAAFCAEMKDTLPLDSDQLHVAAKCNIKRFENYRKYLQSHLKKLESSIKEEFQQTCKESVRWPDNKSPFLRVLDRLWGCTVNCAFCGEPCQIADNNHECAHSCVQHRPSGVKGIKHRDTKVLSLRTCSMIVASDTTKNCKAWDYRCRNTEHCNATDDEVFHPCREYKKYLPKWDIAPDSAGQASKFWQWAMCRFQDDLLKEHEGTKLDIPESWKETTKQDAIDSLRSCSYQHEGRGNNRCATDHVPQNKTSS